MSGQVGHGAGKNQNMWDDIVNTIFANLIIFCMSFFRDYNLQAVSSTANSTFKLHCMA